jgi:hypothetical protein
LSAVSIGSAADAASVCTGVFAIKLTQPVSGIAAIVTTVAVSQMGVAARGARAVADLSHAMAMGHPC